MHLNDFIPVTTGVDNLNGGSVGAQLNGWGCSRGPTAPGCAAVSGTRVLFMPFLTSPYERAAHARQVVVSEARRFGNSLAMPLTADLHRNRSRNPGFNAETASSFPICRAIGHWQGYR